MRILQSAVALLLLTTASCLSPHLKPASRSIQNVSLAPDSSRWPSGIHLGADYYPAQWPESLWESDISRMALSNVSLVRVNEFDWSVLEPKEGQFNFTVLDKTLDLFQKYGIKAIIGTPTAGLPDWLMEKYHSNPVDVINQTLLFGSRRHYSFSSFADRILSQKITTVLAERYSSHEAVAGWQLDNEFGDHNTVRSYDNDAKIRFRWWLKETIENMNDAQGRVFWSSQYASFDAVEPPFFEVYINNSAHQLDWYTFSSDMVTEFAKEQVTILRKYAPRQFITTNFQMLFTLIARSSSSDYDHYKFARDTVIDLATLDQYPLSGSTYVPLSDQEVTNYLRTSVPDFQAMNHALYRGISGAAYGQNHGILGAMEMEPGVLNWVQYRVSPAEGMVRLWMHENFPAPSDMVDYFRWRQAPFAQEQTLSGLFTADNIEDEGYVESQVFAQEDLRKLIAAGIEENESQADVALVFDYTSEWVWTIDPYSGTWSVTDAEFTGAVLT